MARYRLVLLAALLPVVACAPPASGWGADGHRIVAEIAVRRLTPQTAEQIDRLLGGLSLPEVSTWADEVRPQEPYRWSAPMHYVNLAPGAVRYDGGRDCPEVGCVVEAIRDFSAVLADETRPDEERAEALKFVVHFVGDVHQPLHAGRGTDRGGNDIGVELGEREANLHGVWDSGILNSFPSAWPLRAERLNEQISDELNRAWAEPEPGVWATESYQLALAFAYDVPAGGVIDDAYLEAALPIVEWRLRQAGVRLAHALNRALDPASADGPEADDQPMGAGASDGSEGAAAG